MINDVRNTVLAVLNKNNYGYISPSDFNLYSKQAQMELFEEYFSSYNKAINMENVRQSGTDYAEIIKPITETIERFSQFKPLVPVAPVAYPSNNYYYPSLITTGDEAYMINKIVCYPDILTVGTNTSVVINSLVDSTANFVTAGVSAGDIVTNKDSNFSVKVVALISPTQLLLDGDIFTGTGDSYAIIDASEFKDAERVSQGKITQLLNSVLTSPSNIFPAYTLGNEIFSLYPTTFTTMGQVYAQYFRLPKAPKWTYITLINGEPSFDQTQPDYQDFELPLEDEYKLATKILEYCGMSIREAEVVQFGMAQQQHEQPTFSMQQ